MTEQAELDALRSEAPIETAPTSEPQAAPQPAPTADAFKPLCAELVRGFGMAICSRAKVENLSPDEVQRLASALASVAACYDLANLDPRTAAWLTLAIAVSSVAIPRLQAPKIEATKPETVADVAATG